MKLPKLSPLPALKSVFNKCMSIPDYNSRLVFLTNAAVIHTIALWQTWNYLHTAAADRDQSYPTIIGILLAGHATSAFGRFLTKKEPDAPDDNDALDADAPAGKPDSPDQPGK
jgi:hypothetical protein